MTLEQRLIALAQAMGADVKALLQAQGSLSALSTTAKNNLVAAINELKGAVDGGGGGGGTGSTGGLFFRGSHIQKEEPRGQLANVRGFTLFLARRALGGR